MRQTHTEPDGPPKKPRPHALALLALSACILRPVPGDSTTDTTDTSSTSITADPLSTSTTTPTNTGTPEPISTSAADTTSTVDFILKLDSGDPDAPQCNGLKQPESDCPPGQKCTIDGTLTATHCVDVVRDPKGLYEPCTVLGDLGSGLDDCGPGLLCWNYDIRGHGICHGLCDGTPDNCVCADPWATPSFCQECAVGICDPGCNPLAQDCPGGDPCIPLSDDSADFLCVLDASGEQGQTNDPCEVANACDQGLLCLPTAEASSACMQDIMGCCQPFCETTQMSPCPNPDQACVPWFPPMSETPPGLEHLGICKIPP